MIRDTYFPIVFCTVKPVPHFHSVKQYTISLKNKYKISLSTLLNFLKIHPKLLLKDLKLCSIFSSSDKSVDKMHPRYLYLRTLDKTLPLNEKLMSSDKFFFQLKIIETVLLTLPFNFNLSKKLSILLSKTCNPVEVGDRESKTRSSA